MTLKLVLALVAALIAVAVLLGLPHDDLTNWLAVGLLVASVAVVAP